MHYKEIKKIIIDFDGVLTDGKIFYTHDGKVFKGTNTRDVRAIRELISNGYDVTILTASSWSGASEFSRRTGADIVTMRDKTEYVNNINDKFIAIGDDVWDIPLLLGSEYFFAPKDCDKFIKENTKTNIIDCNGGCGVIAELVWILCDNK